MNRFAQRYGIPIAIMIGGGWLLRLIRYLFTGSTEHTLVIIATAILLFSFGMNLSQHKKRNHTWIKKVLVSFLFLFLLLWDLGYFILPQIKAVMNFLAIEGVVISMLYIYCGWTFFD